MFVSVSFSLTSTYSTKTNKIKSSEQIYSTNMSSTRFSVDYSKRVSKCKKCKVEMEKQIIRLAKIVPNPFGDDGDMKQYYHVECLFETFTRARANTKVIETADDIEEFEALKKADKDLINDLIKSKPITKELVGLYNI